MEEKTASIEEVMESLKDGLQYGFTLKKHTPGIKHAIERSYNPEIIKHYYISGITN